MASSKLRPYAEEDIGRPIAWLAIEQARFISGSIVMLDGGQMQLR